MNKLFSIFLASFFVIYSWMPAMGKEEVFSPDFAFPITVINHADSILNLKPTSVKTPQLLEALVQYSLAKSMISRYNFSSIIHKMDSVAAKEKNLAARGIIYSLEAEIFSSYYNSKRWYQSEVVADTIPHDYSEWSDQQFKNKIISLVKLSLENRDVTLKSAVSDFKPVVIYDKYGELLCPTIYDMLLKRGINLIENRIDDNDQTINKLIEQQLKYYTNNIPVSIYYEILKAESDKNRFFYNPENIINLYSKYKDCEYAGLILSKLQLYLIAKENRKAIYTILHDFKAKFPSYPYMWSIQALMNELCEKRISVNGNSEFSTTENIKLSVENNNVPSFKLSIYRLPDSYDGEYKNFPKIENMNLIATNSIETNKTIPFNEDSINVNFAPLPFGRYTVISSYIAEGKEQIDYSKDIFNVTDIKLFGVNGLNNKNIVAATAGSSGIPLKNIELELKNNKKEITHLKTNSKGILEIKDENYTISARKDNDKYAQPLYIYSNNDINRKTDNIEINTDLAVYHEGDTVKFVAIAYSSDRHRDDVIYDLKCEARLLNANDQVVDSINLSSDKYGRLYSSFVIPKGGLLGNYTIRIKSLKDNTQAVSVIEVAAYKLPTFSIEMDETSPQYPKNTPIRISGKIMSFSGIPLDNNDVEIILKKSDWMPWWRNNYSSTIVETTKVKTNEQGVFSYTIPSNKVESNNKEFFQYSVEILTTSLSGETQTANQYFIVGETSQLEFTNKKIFEVSTPIILPVELHSTSKDVPECNYSIINLKKDTVLAGTFIPQKSLIDLSNVPSGKYKLTVGINNDTSSIVSSDIIIYRETDKDSPVDTPLWIPQLRIKADSNNKASFLIGNETDNNHIYYITSIKDKVLSSGWIKLGNGLKRFNVDIPKDAKENINVSFIMVKNFKTYYAHALIDNNIVPDSLKITIESFRNKLTAGNTEKWKFHFVNSSNNGTPAAMILNVSNKAIEEIAPNRFVFTPIKYYYRNISFVTAYNSKFYSSNNYIGKNLYSNTSLEYPNLNLYGYKFFYNNKRENVYHSFGIVRAALAGDGRRKSRGMAHINETISSDAAQEEFGNKVLDNVVVRKGNVNTALWLPMLETDENGNVDVSFNVPNENTTWLVKAIGYTKNLLVDDISREIVANKPIMVEPNLPRFLRQGDDAVINALVINSSDTIQHCAAIVELFDYTTNRVIYSKNFNLEIPVNKQKLCPISWNVPDSISFVGYRIKAANQSFSDGEQSLLPILPSISPVIESLPFFINSGSEEMKIQVPKIPISAKVTLEYCNNPTWSCVTALPSIFNTSAITATQATHTLYAILTAQGIAKMNPKIKEAVEYWTKNPKDSVLVSTLEKNQSLKITELSNSPWLTAAQQETLQMQGISKLYDPIYCDNIKNKMIDILASLQQSNGGWSWYKNSPSSYYTSTQILQLLGELKNLNYLSYELKLQEMIEKGVKYLDNEVIRQYNEQKNKSDMSRFCHYAYVRSFFLDIPQSVTLKDFTDKALDIYSSSWKRMSIPDKAYSAIVLQRYDRNQPAKEIIRSIGQFAISTPSQGTYWDNLKGGYFYNKVSITSLILQAIHAVDANSKLIDPVRQWILLQKQTQNWGNSSLATDAIYTLLSTGSNWIEPEGKAYITINGNPLSFNETSKYLGYEKNEIPASEISGNLLSVFRKGTSPAWGALYWQYASPMAEIKAASTPDISITKTLYTVDGNKLINNSELKVGDRVRVRLVVKNKQNLEYVNIVDERCATAEPMKQLSGYNFEDNIGYYLEMQNSDTNMYIYSLPKGTHIFHYDVTITSAGEYNLGIATVQCQYAPQFTAHSAGAIVTVK